MNLANHFSEIIPSNGDSISLVTAQNGINTSLDEFQSKFSQSIIKRLPEDTLYLGLYNPTDGVLI